MAINSNLVLAFYSSHMNAEEAFKTLHKACFDKKKLPLIHQYYRAEEDIVSNYTFGDRITSWGRFGAVCGWICGMGFGAAFSIVPGVDPIMDGGPIAGWLFGALGTAIVLGSLSAFGATVASLFSTARSSALEYRAALKAAGRSVLATHKELTVARVAPRYA